MHKKIQAYKLQMSQTMDNDKNDNIQDLTVPETQLVSPVLRGNRWVDPTHSPNNSPASSQEIFTGL